MADEKFHSYIKYLLLILIPVVIVITLLIGMNESIEFFGLSIPSYDYVRFYVPDWLALINGQNPYHYFNGITWVSSYYPIGFQSFSVLALIHILAPKVLFCLIWLYTIYFINNLCKKHNVSRKTTIYFCFGLILLNPIYLGSVLISGHDDVVIGLCILLTVYFVENGEKMKSSLSAIYAFLIKFVGAIVLFPIVFIKKKVNWRIGVFSITIIGGVYLIGYLLWGSYVFWPFEFQFFRPPEEGSTLLFIKNVLGIDLAPYLIYIFITGAIIVCLFLYFKNTDISSFALILVLGFLIVIPTYFVHYGAWFIPLAIYWCLTHNGKLQGTIFYYHVGGLIAAVISLFISPGWGALIMTITTALFALVIYLNRKKEMDESQIEEKRIITNPS